MVPLEGLLSGVGRLTLYSSVVEGVPAVLEALGVISSISVKQNRNTVASFMNL